MPLLIADGLAMSIIGIENLHSNAQVGSIYPVYTVSTAIIMKIDDLSFYAPMKLIIILLKEGGQII